MALELKLATKEKSKLKMALLGLPGAGKTWTALNIASNMVEPERILLLDSEGESASKYAHKFTFNHHAVGNVDPKTEFDPRNLVKVLKEIQTLPVDFVIIDSFSHYWWRLLELVNTEFAKLGNGKHDTFTGGWNKATPIQRELFQTIIRAPYHMICTLRMKADTHKDEQTGKVRKVGTKAEARENCEYEFDMAAELDMDHTLRITKTRCDTLDIGKEFYHPGKDLADELLAWLNLGVDKVQVVPPISDDAKAPPAKPEQQPTKAPQPDPAAASGDDQAHDPSDDDRPMSEEQFTKLLEAAKANGWNNFKVFQYAAKKYNVPTDQVLGNIALWQGYELYDHVTKNKP